jgi:hypothetical protein
MMLTGYYMDFKINRLYGRSKKPTTILIPWWQGFKYIPRVKISCFVRLPGPVILADKHGSTKLTPVHIALPYAGQRP